MIIVWFWSSKAVPNGEMQLWTTDDGDSKLPDELICINQKKQHKFELIRKVEGIISNRISENNRIFIFLHRSSAQGFNSSDVVSLLESTPESLRNGLKIFLFGENSDYLYLMNSRHGILGPDKSLGGIVNGTNYQVIASEKEKTIVGDKFAKIWKYYEHEFKMKIFELYEELMVAFFAHIAHPQPEGSLLQTIRQHDDDLLFLRILSLVNHKDFEKPDRDLTDVESSLIPLNYKDQLRLLEKKHHKSYIFDDCNANILEIYGPKVRDEYQVLKTSIDRHLLSSVKNPKPSKEIILIIEKAFDNLLAGMPEATFY